MNQNRPAPPARHATGGRTLAIFGGVLAASVGASLCDAGTRRHDRTNQQHVDLAALPQFQSVGSYSTGSLFGSFTLISPEWGLTAAHVVDTDGDGLVSDESFANDVLRVGGVQRNAAELIVPTGVNGYPGWTGDINDGFDLALVRLSSPVTTITPAPLYTSFQELGKTAVQVGFGQGGTGQTGANTSSGMKRAGENVVDRYVNFANGASALRWDFDEPSPRVSPNNSGSTVPLDLEYLIGPGDSGGGSFIFESGNWFLAGVHSGTYDLFNYPDTTTDTATYGDAALITRVAAYQDFIFSHIPGLEASIPEPAGLTVLMTAGVAALARRRQRRETWRGSR